MTWAGDIVVPGCGVGSFDVLDLSHLSLNGVALPCAAQV